MRTERKTPLSLLKITLVIGLSLGIKCTYAQIEQVEPKIILSNEAPRLRFEQLGIEDGLAQSSGNTIMQDKKGFIWIATQGGLHRYDGHEFKVFSSNPFLRPSPLVRAQVLACL